MIKTILLFLFSTAFLYSQKNNVSGVVFGSEKSLKDVTVLNYSKLLLDKNSNQSIKKWTRNSSKTDASGYFSIENTKPSDTLIFSACDYISQKITVKKFKETKAIQLKTEDCNTSKCSSPAKLQIFIGEKISIKSTENKNCCGLISLDNKYEARYKIIKMLDGDFSNPTIEFTAFDHYGTPAFSKNKTVLLYVNNRCDAFFHIKYQFAAVYKTKDDRWAVPYQTNDYNNMETQIKPEIIQFKEVVKYSIKGNNKEFVVSNYPEPFYKIEGDCAIAVYGNYVEDAIELKKQSVLNK